MYVMRRTTIFIDEQLLQRARRRAGQQGVSFATVVREALSQYLAAPRRDAAAVPSFAGQFASGEPDTSERVDELLWRDPHA